jgi:hypothetical protein
LCHAEEEDHPDARIIDMMDPSNYASVEEAKLGVFTLTRKGKK